MTYSASGYIKPIDQPAGTNLLLGKFDIPNGPRLKKVRARDLHNFPPDLVPEPGPTICFSVDEWPGHNGVEYLLDGYDYALESDIDLPHLSSDRLKLLAKLLGKIINDQAVARLLIALTDCEEIEKIKYTNRENIIALILSDCEIYSPPNVLYVCDLVPIVSR
jgi:hypothetical protein